MYSLLVSWNNMAWESEQRMRMSADRFREYSGDESQALSIQSPDTLKQLERVTTLLMYERGVDNPPGEIVRIGQVRDIRVHQGDLNFRFAETGRLTRSFLWEQRHRLQLLDSEFTRTHWAVKDGDLPQDLLAKMVETEKRYDIVLSFAGEDREYVEKAADFLDRASVSVFYDRNEEASLWGKDLVEHLDLVYRRRGRYCVMFVSSHYAAKMWTTHERRSAMTRALEERTEYILPVRFDQTEIPGLRSTIGYVEAAKKTPEQLARLILQKLGRSA